MCITFLQFYSYSTLLIHISSPFCSFSFLSFQTKMITIHVKPGRLSLSSTQLFYIIKTGPQHIVIILSSTENSFLLSISTLSHISCNCRNQFQSCKHILFLVATCGFLPHCVSHLSLSHRSTSTIACCHSFSKIRSILT